MARLHAARTVHAGVRRLQAGDPRDESFRLRRSVHAHRRDAASGPALSTYVAQTLLTPLDKELVYETHTVSAHALFDFDKSILKDQGKAELHKLAGIIEDQGMTVADIDVVGHTDNVGSDAYNQGLSVRRATAVRNYLVSQGVDAGIVDVMGMGKRDPVASNDTPEGRAKNRRVDVLVGARRQAQ